MATTIRINKSGTLRVVIKKHEILNWIPEDAPQALAKHWIEVGRERETLREQLEEQLAAQQKAFIAEVQNLEREVSDLKEILKRYVEFFTQFAHVSTLTTSIDQYELETIKFKKKNGKLTQDESNKYNLSEIKDKLFRKLLNNYFPDIEHDFLLTNFKKNEESDA